MGEFSRMPNYDVRNDGAGPYAIFYCDICGREFRSTPDIAKAVSQDLGRQALGGLLRKVPLVGGSVADNVVGEDPRYSMKMDQGQLQKAWQQVQVHFRQCPTCDRIVCLSDFDTQSGFCQDDSPRQADIAEARGAQAGAAIKGFADAFGLGGAIQKATEAAKKAQEATNAYCPNCQSIAPAGTKFCPECGTAMVQPSVAACPKCGTETHGAKFCPNCGEKMESKPLVANCPKCGAETMGAKFCPNCGNKLG
jgi:DNA-directed RNA polymerase subunit M/transcription elongation factor TFIIS